MTQKDFLWLHLKDLPYFRAMLRAAEAAFYQEYDLPSPTLDVGCGDGHFATIAFDRQIDVGIDPWTGPIHKARALGGYRLLVQGDAGRCPFPDATFASALSNSVLEHIPHIDAVLAETARVLRPGATFLFCVPNPRYFSELSISGGLRRIGLRKLGDAYEAWFRRISRVHHADEPEVWEKRLARAGFRLVRWWHYFSPEAMRALEWGHYWGAPTLLPHLLLKRWIIAPTRWNLALTERYVRRFAVPESNPNGAFTFYVCERASDG